MKSINHLAITTIATLALSACAPARSHQGFQSAANPTLQNDNSFTTELPIASPATSDANPDEIVVNGHPATPATTPATNTQPQPTLANNNKPAAAKPQQPAPAPAAPAQANKPQTPSKPPQATNKPPQATNNTPAPAKPPQQVNKPVQPPTHTGALPQNKLPVPAWANTTQNESWTVITIRALKELGSEMIKTDLVDAHDFCPAYHKLNETERQKVWVQLISSMAKFESDLNPLSAYTEGFKGDDNKFVVSRGLLQISKGSANLYGCNITKEAELENPETNIRCGVRILNTLVTKYHAIHGHQQVANANLLKNPWRGAARYWSVLRGKLKDLLIRASVRQMAVCKA